MESWKNKRELVLLGILLMWAIACCIPCAQAQAQSNTPASDSFTLSIHSVNSWVGIDQNYTLWAANLNRREILANTYREHRLNQKDIEILKRFIIGKGIMRYGKDSELITNEQTDLLTQEFPDSLTHEDKLNKTIHISLWREGEEKNIILATTASAKDKWSEDIRYLLKLVARLTKNAKPVECDGIGFLQSLEYKKDDYSTWAQWAKSLNSNKDFHKLTEKEIDGLPSNLKQMVKYPGFVVALKEVDLMLMTELGWSTPIDEGTTKKERPPTVYDIWWGALEFNQKIYAINAWKIVPKK